ncbi:dolichyl pyrophosphate Glc1Man9GlcNAc2 alpha-1,3-glucosyltransferase-like [Watersipora subatra]|uniref:dolichyl pyrophosphate Glc1Man9GlcNAc2 alpha-1,3-glucosyltransferase-like n=1 Tax=Watersipora subatra TaxID=2589382 RepID=UPI00355C4A99
MWRDHTLIVVALCLSFIKLLMKNTYRSTDYEVHRNWLAITHSLPLDKWYTDTTSEWTLDYPPFFAWFEFTLSWFAPLFDPMMVKVNKLNYVSEASVLFQRLSVICADFLYLYAVYQFCMTCVVKRVGVSNRPAIINNSNLAIGVCLMTNFGLFIVDHIHFQYNGLLFGILLLSITAMYQANHMTAALHFATLLNFKHIYLYMAPAYGIYLLRIYCFSSSQKDGSVLWSSFSIKRFLGLAGLVVSIFGTSFGPFIYFGQLGQVLSRLFPFKRGLCHAYWAPNFWAIYNMADKLLYIAGRKLDLISVSNHSASMTGGLVQEFEHAVLPSVTPVATLLLTVTFMLPTLIHLWLNPSGPRTFIRSLVICAFTSFMFGWHVHEKAILLVTIPLTLLSIDSDDYCRHFIFLSVVSHVSLFPLIYTQFEQPILFAGFGAYTLYLLSTLPHLLPQSADKKSQWAFSRLEKGYMFGLLLVMLYYSVGHSLMGLNETLPFLPLLLMSVYTSIGISYTYVGLYSTILSHRMLKKIVSGKRKVKAQ